MRLLERFEVCLAALDEFYFMSIPLAFEVAKVLLALLEQFIHLDIVLSQ